MPAAPAIDGTPPVVTSTTPLLIRRSDRSPVTIPLTPERGKTIWFTVTAAPVLLKRAKRKRSTSFWEARALKTFCACPEGCSCRMAVATPELLMVRRGAVAGAVSTESKSQFPLPISDPRTSRAIASPLVHPGRLTISWTMVVTSMLFQPVPQFGWFTETLERVGTRPLTRGSST